MARKLLKVVTEKEAPMAYTIQPATEFTAGTGANGYGKRAKISGFYVVQGDRRVRAFTGKDAEQKASAWAKFCNENFL